MVYRFMKGRKNASGTSPGSTTEEKPSEDEPLEESGVQQQEQQVGGEESGAVWNYEGQHSEQAWKKKTTLKTTGIEKRL